MSIQGAAGLSAAVAAMEQIQSSVGKTAERISSATVGGGGDALDLSAEMLALIQARAQHAALANVVQAVDQMAASSLSVLG